jgi:hypothetical protein
MFKTQQHWQLYEGLQQAGSHFTEEGCQQQQQFAGSLGSLAGGIVKCFLIVVCCLKSSSSDGSITRAHSSISSFSPSAATACVVDHQLVQQQHVWFGWFSSVLTCTGGQLGGLTHCSSMYKA